ncbi:MAG TPA: hypothetical protein VGK95_12995 [Caldimonas sp.]
MTFDTRCVATKPLAIDGVIEPPIEPPPPPPPHEAIDSAPNSAAVEPKMDGQERMGASVIDRANANRIDTPSMPCAGQSVQSGPNR